MYAKSDGVQTSRNLYMFRLVYSKLSTVYEILNSQLPNLIFTPK